MQQQQQRKILNRRRQYGDGCVPTFDRYEAKKELSLQVIEKKDRKLEEITTMITEDINPTIEKLQKDRAQFRIFNNNAASIERMERSQTAHAYWMHKKVVDDQAATEEEHCGRLEAAQETLAQATETVAAKEKELAALSKKKEGSLAGEFKALQEAEDEASKVLVKVNSTCVAWSCVIGYIITRGVGECRPHRTPPLPKPSPPLPSSSPPSPPPLPSMWARRART